MSTAAVPAPLPGPDRPPPELLTRGALNDLGDAIAAAAARMSAQLGDWLELLARFDELRGWASWGACSCADWLSYRCAMSPITAREHVRVAHRLAELPLIAAALRRGELSYSKVRALARLEHVADEEQLLELARQASAAQLERIIRGARRVTRAEAGAAVRDRHLHVHLDDDGTASISGRIPVEDGARLLRALEEVDRTIDLDAASPAVGLEDAPTRVEADDHETSASARPWRPPPGPQRRADALAWMAAQSVQGLARELSSERSEVVVHVDAALLAQAAADAPPATGDLRRVPACRLADGAPVALDTVRRLCCDAGIVAIVRDGDDVLSVGRRTRSIPPAIRRALRARHSTCAFPGCSRTHGLDAHHLVPWARGGATALDNLVELCRHHHRRVHEGGWSMIAQADGRWAAQAPDGRVLVAAPGPDGERARARDGAPAAGEGAEAPTSQAAAEGDPMSLMALSAGQRWDLGLAVDAVLTWTTPPPGDPTPRPPAPRAPSSADDAHPEWLLAA